MAKRQYFLVVDTETTQPTRSQPALVADFAAVICDRHGKIYAQCAVLVQGVFGVFDLFYTSDDSGHFSRKTLDQRTLAYHDMVLSGERMLASVNAINQWLTKAYIKYKPTLTAYNLSFDEGKCRDTGIDLSYFSDRFCLWYAAAEKFASTKAYKNFVMQSHAINPPTDKGNCTYKTNAEVMARFVLDDPAMPDEPHTALLDIIGYEIPILVKLVATTKRSVYMTPKAYNWQDFQLKNHFVSN